jgi:hypothetical protein
MYPVGKEPSRYAMTTIAPHPVNQIAIIKFKIQNSKKSSDS